MLNGCTVFLLCTRVQGVPWPWTWETLGWLRGRLRRNVIVIIVVVVVVVVAILLSFFVKCLIAFHVRPSS